VNTDLTDLSHKTLGHMNENGMSLLLRQDSLSGVDNVNLKKFSHCLEGKQTRVFFKSHPPSREGKCT
jgi:hypothetical protein